MKKSLILFFVVLVLLIIFSGFILGEGTDSSSSGEKSSSWKTFTSDFFNSIKGKSSGAIGSVKDISKSVWASATDFLGFNQAWFTKGNIMDNLSSGAGIVGMFFAILFIMALVLAKFASDASEDYTWSKVVFNSLITCILFLIYLVFLSTEEGAFFYNVAVGFLAGLFILLFDFGFFWVSESADSRKDKIKKFAYERGVLSLVVLPVIYATLLWVPILSTFLKTITLYYFTPLILKSFILAGIVGIIPRIIIARQKAVDRARKISGMEKTILGFATARATGEHVSR